MPDPASEPVRDSASSSRTTPVPCVLIPTYNNAASVADVVSAARKLDLPVLIVDDGCTDDSASRAESAGAEVIRHSRNLGKGIALLSGWRAAAERGYSHAISMDAESHVRVACF